MKSNYIDKINGFIVPYLNKNGYELIKTEFVTEDNNNFLRLYIDLTGEELDKRQAKLDAENAKAEGQETEATEPANNEAASEAAQAEADEETITPGVSINDCVKVSRYLSKWLDKEDFIKEMYTMEVCSKGFLDDAATSEDKETLQ